MASSRFALVFACAGLLSVSACIVVEDFQGYGPLNAGAGGAPCDQINCASGGNGPSSSTGSNGGSGVGGSSVGGMGGNGTGGSAPVCGYIACNNSALPCQPTELLSSVGWIYGTDPSAVLVSNVQDGMHVLSRSAKPGCVVSPAPLATSSELFYLVVSDGNFAAWIPWNSSTACGSTGLYYCQTDGCKAQEIPVLTMWPQQGRMQALTLGPDFLYFMFGNGLVGRAAKAAPNPEILWTDPLYAPPTTIPVLLDIQYFNGRLDVTRSRERTQTMGPCDTGFFGGKAAIMNLGAAPGDTWSQSNTNLDFAGSVASSDKYIYFLGGDPNSLLHRVPRPAGSMESLAAAGEIKQTTSLFTPLLEVVDGYVYFEVGFTNGDIGVVRLPADTPNFALGSTVEIVLRTSSMYRAVIDKDAIYWMQCADAQGCATTRLMAAAIKP